MTACGAFCAARVKCSLTLSTCLSNELALQQNVRQDRKPSSSSAKRPAELVQDASMRGAVVNRACTRQSTLHGQWLCNEKAIVFKRKPSRCWLGAVPRYWNVVASCFRFISFAENTSAALAPRAGISQPILLLFFFVFLLLNLSTKGCLRFFLFSLKI